MASGPSNTSSGFIDDATLYNSALDDTLLSSVVNDSEIAAKSPNTSHSMPKDLTFNENETISSTSTPNTDHSKPKTATEIFLDNLKSNDSSMIFVEDESTLKPAAEDVDKNSVLINIDSSDDVIIVSSDEEEHLIDDNNKNDTPTLSSVSSDAPTSTNRTDIVTEKEVQPQAGSSIKLYNSIEEFDNNLPDTVTLLRTPLGGKVYLVGTAHFSEQSQDDVSLVIRNVQPDVIMVELCPARIHILKHDEKTLLEEARDMNMTKVRNIIHNSGVINGVFYILLLNMSAKITKELGIAPGGEFRRAVEEAKRLRNCIVQLGDRPINITVQRALHGLSFWQSIKLLWRLVTSNETISKEEIERCKQKDLLEELMREMSGEYPALGDVFVKERDMYLCHSLQMAAQPDARYLQPVNVVGVVGIGHTVGIKQLWGKVNPAQIPLISIIPPASRSNRIAKFTIKYGTLGLISWGIYKVVRPRLASIL